MKASIRKGDKIGTAGIGGLGHMAIKLARLPLTLELEDYAHTEKVSNLPELLSTEGEPSGSRASARSIAYYAPWGNLAIFYKDFRYSDGLVILGEIDGDIAAL